MDQLFLVVVSGIASGAIYGLLGLGLVIIFRATDVVNFALAGLATMGLYVAITVDEWGAGVVVSLIAAVVVSVVVGLVVREVTIRPLGEGRLFSALVVTMGVSLIVESLVGSWWGTAPKAYPSLVSGAVVVAGAAIPWQSIITIAIAGAAMAAVAYLFANTTLGSAMRAVAESAETAKMLGINAQRIARIAWAMGLGLAAVGACLYAPKSGLAPAVLTAPLFRAFAGIFLGGLTSMYGAVIGGLAIGVLENLAANYVSASFRDTFVFSLTVLVLLIRPQGIFGKRTFARV
jgi:branched-chain amino acid transport system permease protein